MSFLMLAGLVGTAIYGGYALQQEKRAIVSDFTIKPRATPEESKRVIFDGFETICKRRNIKLDKDGYPESPNGYISCAEYLRYQGFDEESVEYFIKKYQLKYRMRESRFYDEAKRYLKKIEKRYELGKHNTILYTFRHTYFGNVEERMEKIMENETWQKLVHHHQYAQENAMSYHEVWVLEIPLELKGEVKKIYKQVCIMEKVNK